MHAIGGAGSLKAGDAERVMNSSMHVGCGSLGEEKKGFCCLILPIGISRRLCG